MADRKKVIKGLELCTNIQGCFENINPKCPYALRDGACRYQDLLYDALALLKEQDTVEHALSVLKAHGWQDGGEAVKPIIERSYTGFWPLCGVCEGALTAQGKYCPHCGRAVKWDD